MNTYEAKAKEIFKDNAVQKWLVYDSGVPRIPRYAAEYLVGYFCKPGQERQGLKSMREQVALNVPEPDRRQVILSQLCTNGTVKFYDLLEVRVDLKNGHLLGSMSNLGLDNVEIPMVVARQYPQLLVGGGVWCSITLSYQPHDKKFPVKMSAVTLFQNNVDLQQYIDARQYFTADEWVDLLLASVGYEPTRFTPREKLLLLVRLAPVVEPNLNLVELGPRQTGKTFLLRNVAASCYTASGAQVTSASLFANVSTGSPGVLATYKIVVLDEISHTTLDDMATISILKDYLESGQFSRGGRVYTSDSSFVMAGNIDVVDGQPDPRYRHLFEPLPRSLQDTALLDRIHGYIPGWEIPVLQPASISSGLALTTNYVGQAFQLLRPYDYREVCRPILNQLALPLTTRDYRAVEKISSALLKLVFPDGRYSYPDLSKIVMAALELRGRVNNQLAVMAPGEFGNRAKMA